MHIVLLDATESTAAPDVDDHGIPALARLARREGHRVSHLRWPDVEGDLLRPAWGALAAGDVLHVVAMAERLPVLARLPQPGPPMVLTIVDLPPAGDRPRMLASTEERPQARLCVVRSAYAAQRWREHAPAADVRVLPRGVDLLALLSAAAAGADRPASRGPVANREGPHRTLVCVGPFDERSGIDTLLRAFAAVDQPEWRLHLLGPFDVDTGFGGSCAALAARNGRVIVGAAPPGGSLARIGRPVDLVCVPRLDPQAFALTVHEAATLGVPCLVSQLGAQLDAVHAYRCGTGVEPGDERAWTAALSSGPWPTEGRVPVSPTGPLPLPMRIEEEAFLYEGLYRQAVHARHGLSTFGT